VVQNTLKTIFDWCEYSFFTTMQYFCHAATKTVVVTPLFTQIWSHWTSLCTLLYGPCFLPISDDEPCRHAKFILIKNLSFETESVLLKTEFERGSLKRH
jgi:hypothetical protein